MKSIAKRKPGFEIGRYCHICGKGQLPGDGIAGFTPALEALGYDLKGQIGFAHVKCVLKARRNLKSKTVAQGPLIGE